MELFIHKRDYKKSRPNHQINDQHSAPEAPDLAAFAGIKDFS